MHISYKKQCIQLAASEENRNKMEEPEYVVVARSLDKDAEQIELPTDQDKMLRLQTLVEAFPGAHSLKYKNPKTGAFRTLMSDNAGDKFHPPSDGWSNKVFLVLSQTQQTTRDKPNSTISSKRRRLEDSLSDEKKESYWELYKHYLFYTNLDGDMKAAASLLDDYHVVLCMHEIPGLQNIRRELNEISAERGQFLAEYDGDMDFKERKLTHYDNKISNKEDELKKRAKNCTLNFFDHQNNSFNMKVVAYTWRDDICIMRSKIEIYHGTPGIECCDRGTNYFMMGFRPPEYTHCIIEGIISTQIDGHFLASPGAFPGMSGGPVIQKFDNGTGRLLGICSGAQNNQEIGMHSSMAEITSTINESITNLPFVLIIPAYQFINHLFPGKIPTSKHKLMDEMKELHLSRPSSTLPTFSKIGSWEIQSNSNQKAILCSGKLWFFFHLKFPDKLFGGGHVSYFDVEGSEWCQANEQFSALSSAEHLDEILFTHQAEICLLLYSQIGKFQVHSLHHFDTNQWVWKKVMFAGWQETVSNEEDSKNTLILVNSPAANGVYFLSYVRHQFGLHLLEFPSLNAPTPTWTVKFDGVRVGAEKGIFSQLQPTQAAHTNGTIFIMGHVLYGSEFLWQKTKIVQLQVEDQSIRFIEIGPDRDHPCTSFNHTGPIAHSILPDKNQWMHFADQNMTDISGSTFNGEIWAIQDLTEEPKWKKLKLEIPQPKNAHGSKMHIVFTKENGQLFVAHEGLGVLSASLSI